MIYVIEFILFLIYTFAVFFIKNYYILALVCAINILLMIILRIDLKKAITAMLKISPIIIFTTTINIIISGISFGLLIGIRLILVCNMTYIFSKKMPLQRLEYVIEVLFKPLKIVNVDSREIGIIVCIGVTFIPIIQREMSELKYSLKAKGFEINFKNLVKNSNYILLPLLTSIIKRIGEIEGSLYSKGYVN